MIFRYLLILIIFAPSSLLVIERANTDILIFLFIVLMVYSNSSTLNFAILTLISLAKYYPVTLMVNFFIEKKRSIKQIIIILLLFIIIVIYIYTDSDTKIFGKEVWPVKKEERLQKLIVLNP